MFLGMVGHEVKTVPDGEEAAGVRALTRRKSSCWTSGCRHRRLRGGPPNAREASDGLFLIALTGYGQPEDMQATRQAGFHAHLVKPIDPIELLRLIEEWRANAPGRQWVLRGPRQQTATRE